VLGIGVTATSTGTQKILDIGYWFPSHSTQDEDNGQRWP
jgi:hypothetical protein